MGRQPVWLICRSRPGTKWRENTLVAVGPRSVCGFAIPGRKQFSSHRHQVWAERCLATALVHTSCACHKKNGSHLQRPFCPLNMHTRINQYCSGSNPASLPPSVPALSRLDVGNGGWGAHCVGSGPAAAVARSARRSHGLSAGAGQPRSGKSPRTVSAGPSPF